MSSRKSNKSGKFKSRSGNLIDPTLFASKLAYLLEAEVGKKQDVCLPICVLK